MTDQSLYAFNFGPMLPPRDHVNDALDDMAALALHWERNRQRGRVPGAIRAAMVMVAQEIAAQVAIDEAKNRGVKND